MQSQSFTDIEHLFVDGGSTDGTIGMIYSAYPSPKILSNITGGIAKAMNAGIQAACGKIVAHLHSDDYYLSPSVLARVADVFEQTGCEWLFGRIVSDINGRIEPEHFQAPEFSYASLIRSNYIPHPATFVKRDLYSRAGLFDENVKFAMDYDMWLRLAALSTPLQLREPLAAFRRHAGSATHANRLKSHREDLQIRLRYSGRSPIHLIEYWARYFVRRQRLIHEMKGNRRDEQG